MAEDNRDMLMMFKGVGGEAQSVLAGEKDDPLAKDFTAGNFFEIKDFKFGVNQVDSGGSGSGGKPTLTDEHKKAGYEQKADGTIVDKEGKTIPGGTVSSPKFTNFVTNKGKTSYPSDLDPFEFTRFIDIASVSLFQGLTTLKTFPSVSLVKRKAMGVVLNSDTIALRGYLRFDFTDVLLTDLDWEEDDVVKETVKFICRGVTVRYFPEMLGGNKLDTNQPSRTWSFKNTTVT
jgi:type VI protein secretion system component Hcp